MSKAVKQSDPKQADSKVEDKKNKIEDKSQKKEEVKETKAVANNKDNNNNNKDNNKDNKNKDNKDNNNNNKDKNVKEAVVVKKDSPPPPNKKEEPKVPEKTVEQLEDEKSPAYNVDDEVVLTKDRMGIIRFKGQVPELGSGIFYGVELTDGSVGHNDGQIKSVRYFKTEEKRAMFVGYEKIRRKMTKRDHKRVDSFHAASDLQKKLKEGADSTPSNQESSNIASYQDNEKEPVLSASEVHRQRQESLAQQEESNNNNNNNNNNDNDNDNDYKESKEIQTEKMVVFKTENLLQFIMRQNNSHRSILLDTFANPKTHTIIVEAFNQLKDMENQEEQVYAWAQLISRWQKYL